MGQCLFDKAEIEFELPGIHRGKGEHRNEQDDDQDNQADTFNMCLLPAKHTNASRKGDSNS